MAAQVGPRPGRQLAPLTPLGAAAATGGKRDLASAPRTLPPARNETAASSGSGGQHESLSSQFRSRDKRRSIREETSGSVTGGASLAESGSKEEPELGESPTGFRRELNHTRAEPNDAAETTRLLDVDLTTFELEDERAQPAATAEPVDDLAEFSEAYGELGLFSSADAARTQEDKTGAAHIRTSDSDDDMEEFFSAEDLVDHAQLAPAEFDDALQRIEREAQRALQQLEAVKSSPAPPLSKSSEAVAADIARQLHDLTVENQRLADDASALDAKFSFVRDRADAESRVREHELELERAQRESEDQRKLLGGDNNARGELDSEVNAVDKTRELERTDAVYSEEKPLAGPGSSSAPGAYTLSQSTRRRVQVLQDHLVDLARRFREKEADALANTERAARHVYRPPDAARTKELLAMTATLNSTTAGMCTATSSGNEPDMSHDHMHARARLAATMLSDAMESEIVSQRVHGSATRMKLSSLDEESNLDSLKQSAQVFAHTQTGELFLKPSRTSEHVSKVVRDARNPTVDFVRENRRSVRKSRLRTIDPEKQRQVELRERRARLEEMRRQHGKDFIRKNRDHVKELSETLTAAIRPQVVEEYWSDEEESWDDEYEGEYEDEYGDDYDDDDFDDETVSSMGQDEGKWLDDFE